MGDGQIVHRLGGLFVYQSELLVVESLESCLIFAALERNLVINGDRKGSLPAEQALLDEAGKGFERIGGIDIVGFRRFF